jgi:hypothetical protein
MFTPTWCGILKPWDRTKTGRWSLRTKRAEAAGLDTPGQNGGKVNTNGAASAVIFEPSRTPHFLPSLSVFSATFRMATARASPPDTGSPKKSLKTKFGDFLDWPVWAIILGFKDHPARES